MKYECKYCGWIGDESELETIFKEADEEVCPECGEFEECKPVEEPIKE